MGERKYKYSLKKKIVFGICSVAAVTYATSAFFMFVLYDMLVDLIPMNYNLFVSLTLFLGVVWCGIFGLMLATYIVRPIKELEQAASKVASGDISIKVKTPKSDDELRALATAYNDMILGLRSMVQDIDQNFRETNERVIEIKEASSSAAGQAENISKNVEEISLGAEGSALAITETASSMETVTSIAHRVQKNAENTDRLSAEMEHTLQESRQDVESLVKGIQDIATNNEKSLVVVQRLETHANKVGEILSLVGDVAEQTNLLALNASIEAARAGEHGKGFAVVADEVRKLADESANAVKGITELIRNIQDEVRNVVQQIENQVKIANVEAKKGVKTNESIEGMSEAGLEVAQSIRDIIMLIQEQMVSIEGTSRQSEEVAAIAEETSAGALEVSSVTQEQTATMEEIAAAAEMLGGHAEKLKQTIDRFSL